MKTAQATQTQTYFGKVGLNFVFPKDDMFVIGTRSEPALHIPEGFVLVRQDSLPRMARVARLNSGGEKYSHTNFLELELTRLPDDSDRSANIVRLDGIDMKCHQIIQKPPVGHARHLMSYQLGQEPFGYARFEGLSDTSRFRSEFSMKLSHDALVSLTRAYLQEQAKLHDLHTAGDDSASGFGLPS